MIRTPAMLLDRAAETWGSRIALEDDQGTITYAKLRENARTAAIAMMDHGLMPGGPVAVYLPKSIASVVTFYAALYAGAPYAPIDYAAPLQRLERTFSNLQPAVTVTNAQGAEKLRELGTAPGTILLYEDLLASAGDDKRIDAVLREVTDLDAAYIMYTSGSTGIPKGVAIPCRGVLDYAAWLVELFHFTEEEVFGLQSGFHFDNSVFDLYAAVSVGAKVVIIPEILFMYPQKLPEYMNEKAITCIFWVPTVMISMANSGALEHCDLPTLRTVVFAGEVMPNRQLNQWRKALPGRTYVNLYGPTEITVDCTAYVVDRPFADEDPLPIGYDRPNMRVLLLKEDGTLAAPGETGELCVIGSAVALGYWNNPEETARAFAPNPLNPAFPERMYRTGDLACRQEDGCILYLGRKDSQIKLRGNRIEMGDIETAARCIEGIENAAALFDREKEEIVLFLETAQAITQRRFNVALGKYLPKYMLPGRVVAMERLPLTPNRKIDRQLLKQTYDIK